MYCKVLPLDSGQEILAHRKLYNHGSYSVTESFIKFNLQHSTMSSVLPFDIIALIIDIVGENNDTNLLKDLALVSHSFLQTCSKHLFATVELHDADPKRRVASSKKGFVKLLESRPEVVKYIRKLTYKWGDFTFAINYYSPIQVSKTRIKGSHPFFQTSSEQFFVSAASQLMVQIWTGIHWTLPGHQHSFTSCNFLPLITSTSHLSKISQCLVSLHLSTCVGSIYHI